MFPARYLRIFPRCSSRNTEASLVYEYQLSALNVELAVPTGSVTLRSGPISRMIPTFAGYHGSCKMLITELKREECLELVARSHLARLACTQAKQPYIVPINYVFDQMHLYCFTTLGQKVEWMRANPMVCVEIDDIVHNRQWESVIATGRYEEMQESPGRETAIEHAWSLLQGRPNWWEPGYVKTVVGDTERPLEPIFFRISLGRITGHRAAADVDGPSARSGLSGFAHGLFGRGN